jgi:SAM-dependent methyltransferase
VRLIGPPEMDGEHVGLSSAAGGSEEVVHLHDYARIYATPGLYERIVQELLECRSPQVCAQAFARSLTLLGIDPSGVLLLDVGAGTGLVGELVAGLGLAGVVGIDLLAAARCAASRDRPGAYREYLVGDLAEAGATVLERLRRHRFGGMIAAGALGGTHMPPVALERALGLLAPGAPVVFSIDERWSATDEPGGFRTPLARMIGSGRLRLLERSRFRHRRTTTGEPVHYELIVAATGL